MADDLHWRAHESQPATKRVYQFETFQIARHFDLSYSEWPILLALCLLANKWTGQFEGTYTDLANDTLAHHRTVVSAVDRLAKAGAIEVVRPFTRGHTGTVLILVYANLIVVPPKYVGPAPLLLRSGTASADWPNDTDADQPFSEKLAVYGRTEGEGLADGSRDRVVPALGKFLTAFPGATVTDRS